MEIKPIEEESKGILPETEEETCCTSTKLVRKKQSDFSININASRHELPLLKELIKLYGWQVRNSFPLTPSQKEIYLKDKKADLIWLYFLNKTDSKSNFLI